MKKKNKKILLSIGTILGAAALNYTLVNSPFSIVIVLVLLAHELGHYFIAKRNDGDPDFPIFIPLPFIIIALTKVSAMNADGRKQTALSGPVCGFLAAVLFIIFNNIFRFMSNIPLMLLAFSEIVMNYFGSDGRKYREAKKERYYDDFSNPIYNVRFSS